MENKTENSRKEKRFGQHWLRDWLILVVATFLILFTIALCLPHALLSSTVLAQMVLVFSIAGLVIGSVLLGLWWFLHWIWNWRNFKRFLFGIACLATLIALFYAEEDWRGKHDWEKYKQAEAAKGVNFDWESVVPPPVPDDQNFAFSPVWIAAEKYNFWKNPERAKAWYGDRIDNDDVARLAALFPVQPSGLVGTNGWNQKLPSEPDFTNSWQAGSKIDLTSYQNYYRTLQLSNPIANIPITPQPQTPAQDVLLALSKYDPVIEQLRTDSALPESRFPITYNQADKPGILLPHLAALKRQALVLNLRSLAELDNGQPDKALADIRLNIRLANAIHSEPFIISQLVRIAIFNIALQSIWEGLANRQWSDKQLAVLDADLANLDFLADYGKVLHGEVGFHSSYVEFLRENPGQVINMMNNYGSNMQADRTTAQDIAEEAAKFHLIPGGWFYQNQLRMARAVEDLSIPVIDLPNRTVLQDRIRQTDAIIENEQRHPTPFNFMENLFVPAVSNLAKTFVRGQSYADLARVAIALERYRLAHGQYPESLEPLEPQYISALPHDVINGQPLKYRRDSDGQFVLYSVGWNETDDGGVVVMNKNRGTTGPGVNLDQGDWVWRYPAGN